MTRKQWETYEAICALVNESTLVGRRFQLDGNDCGLDDIRECPHLDGEDVSRIEALAVGEVYAIPFANGDITTIVRTDEAVSL